MLLTSLMTASASAILNSNLPFQAQNSRFLSKFTASIPLVVVVVVVVGIFRLSIGAPSLDASFCSHPLVGRV